MFSLQIAIVSLLLFTAIVADYAKTSQDASETKILIFKAMNKNFREESLNNTVSQILLANGPCVSRREKASEALKQLGEKLLFKGIEMEVGFLKNGKCNCLKPWQIVEINGR